MDDVQYVVCVSGANASDESFQWEIRCQNSSQGGEHVVARSVATFATRAEALADSARAAAELAL
jgi:hypothetical protein